MSWEIYIKKLLAGETIQFRPRGNSMSGKIESGDLCTVAPIGIYDDILMGDIVLCKVKGREYFHLVKAVNGNRYQIGNNHGHINGWISRNNIFGKLIKLE